MAVNSLTGRELTFEETKCEETRKVAQPTRRIFTDEEHQGREFLPIPEADKVNWVSLFLNQPRIFY